MTEKLMKLLKEHLRSRHEVVFYEYQNRVAERIIDALVQNLQLTSHSSEAEIRKLKLVEVAIEFSRQAGKTTTVVHVIEFIMIYFPRLFGRPVSIGIFAPQREQAKTDFDRLKAALRRNAAMIDTDEITEQTAKDESNAKTITLPNGSSCYIFPVTTTSKPESKTLDLEVFEESQDLADTIVQGQIWPMGANTNAPRVYIGTAGTRICYFYRLVQSGKALMLRWTEIAEQKRAVYEATGESKHLIYENFVRQEMEKMGADHDDFKRPYNLEWLIGTGQFVTQEDLEALVDLGRKRTFHMPNRESGIECFAGIDTAKNPDSTVVTILRWNAERKVKELINWMELRGENYQTQFEIIHEFLKKYPIIGVAIDSTGQGDFMPDMFENNTAWQDENTGLYRMKFSAVSKDVMYKNLKVSVKGLLTRLPLLDTKEAEKFKLQMLDLQQEHKGQLLSVHHPDDPQAHDDYPDSWALAEWAFAKYNENRVDISVIEQEQPEDEAHGLFSEVWER